MARPNVSRYYIAITITILWLSMGPSEAAPKKAKKVKCKDKWYPNCHKKTMYCPEACLRDCYVDCARCEPVCSLPPPSPSPPPPRPRGRRHPPPPPPYQHSPPPPPPAVPVPVPHSPPPPYQHSPPPPTVPVPVPHSPPPPYPHSPPPPAVPVPVPHSPPPPYQHSPPPPVVPVPVPHSPPPPDTSGAAGGKRVRCRNKDFPTCFGVGHTCPAACPNQCQVDCTICSPVCECNRPGAVCQDPRFVGGDGLTFYFHGKKDRHFCLISDANLHINAHFIGKPGPKPGSRDFTWVSSLGVLFGSGHNLSISALPTASWDDSVDHLSLSLDDSLVTLSGRSEFRSATVPTAVFRRPAGEEVNSVEVELEGVFSVKARVVPITVEDSRIHNYGVVDGVDCFAHLDVSFRFFSLGDDVDGVLGRTYGPGYVSRVKMGVSMPVLGGDREFAASGLFQPDCAVAKYVSPL